MTKKTPFKTRARELQAATGWGYSRCLALVKRYPDLDVTEIAKLAEKEDCGGGAA